MSQFIIRLDDACPTMDHAQWNKFFTLLDEYDVKPLIAVIPENKNKQLEVDPPDPAFWSEVKSWKEKGYCIAMHGYDHVYISTHGGILKINNKSEFAGVPYELQRKKLKAAQEKFMAHGLAPEIFIAPAHTFDMNTLKALKEVTSITTISDGYSVNAYKSKGFNWIPQQLWGPVNKSRGVWTICFHPNTSNDKELNALRRFLDTNRQQVVRAEEVKFRRPALIDHGYRNYFHLKKAILKVLMALKNRHA